jgi:hypothetical protein
VLAARGMPTLLLQDQLESLVEELVAAVPEKRAHYEALLPAATDLREMRRRHLGDAQVEEVARAFDRAAGPEWSARFPFTGEMLASAVADELEGMEAAANGIVAWLSDPARFPAAWTGAVAQALARSRAQAAAAQARP